MFTGLMRIAFLLGTTFFRKRVGHNIEGIGKAVVHLLDEGVDVPHIGRIRGLGATEDGFKRVFLLVHVLLAEGLSIDGGVHASGFVLTAGLAIVNDNHGRRQLTKVVPMIS
jgi:hypothetical protein